MTIKKLVKVKNNAKKAVKELKSAKSVKESSNGADKNHLGTGGGNDTILTCQWDVWISGTKLGVEKKSLITSIEIKETVDGADTATLHIADPEFQFIEDNIFKEKNPIKIKAGWSAYKYRFKFKGFISMVDIDFESDGIPKLTLTCMDNTFKMNKKVKSKTWKNKTSAQVVESICKEYGLQCQIEPNYKFKKQKSISQKSQTDIEFIQKLAQDEVHPFTARLVNANTFVYEKKGKMSAPKMSLTYRAKPYDVISFSPKINKEEKQTNKGTTETESKVSTSGSTGVNVTSNGTVSSGPKSSNNNNTSQSSANTPRTVKRDAENRKWVQ